MWKTILNVGRAVTLISAIAFLVGIFMLRSSRSFDNGVSLLFYSFLACVASGLITFIAKIIVSQRG
jgi:hypothetical protein